MPPKISHHILKLTTMVYAPSGYGLFQVSPKTVKSGTYKLSIKFTGRPINGSFANALNEERIQVNG